MTRKSQSRLTVLLSDDEADRLEAFCRDRGFKKSTLVARLIRQYLDLEGYGSRDSGFRTPRPTPTR